MKKILILLLLALPMASSAQNWLPMIKKVFSCAPAWSKDGGFIIDQAKYEMATYCGEGGYSGKYGFFRIGNSDISIHIYYNAEIDYLPNTMFYVGEALECWSPSFNGRCYSLDGKLLYEGDFSYDNGRPTGTYPTRNYSARSFKAVWEGNNLYLGEFLSGQKDGWGIYIWPNGDCLFGQWKNGNKCGYGMKKFNSTCSIITSDNWNGVN